MSEATHIYKINNEDLLYSTGNYTRYSVITYEGKNLTIYTYTCIYIHSFILSLVLIDVWLTYNVLIYVLWQSDSVIHIVVQ